MSEPKRVELRLTAEEIAALDGRQLVALDHVEACTSCEETFTFEEQQLFDPQDNDHCPKCGRRGTLTTVYGPDPSAWLREHDLGDECFVAVLVDPERDELREEHAALVAAVRAAVECQAAFVAVDTMRDKYALVEKPDGSIGQPPNVLAAYKRLSEAKEARDEALASDLVQRAIARGT